MSILRVNEIQNTGGTAALAVDGTTGKVSFPNSAVLPAGSVVQVVQAETANFPSRAQTSSTSYVSSGYTLSITPSSASSKILGIWNGSLNGSGGNYAYGQFFRNGTVVPASEFVIGGASQWGMAGMTFLDSPASTSAVTYTLYIKASSGTASYGWSSSFASPETNLQGWTLMEIAQ